MAALSPDLLSSLVQMGTNLLLDWASQEGLDHLSGRIIRFVKEKGEDRAIEDAIRSVCIQHNIDERFEQELKNDLRGPVSFREAKDKISNRLVSSNSVVNTDDFLREFVLRLFDNMSSKHKDKMLLSIIFEIESNVSKWLDVSSGYSELTALLEDHQRQQQARKRAFEIGSAQEIVKYIQSQSPSGGAGYAKRKEDQILKEVIQHPPADVNGIILVGPPGAGKSTMLANALGHLQDMAFTKFVFLERFFGRESHQALDEALQGFSNFVVVWDNLHYVRETKDIADLLERLDKLASTENKRFRFIGTSRQDIDLENIYRIKLEKFGNHQLVEDCSKVYSVTLEVSPEEILNEGDGTPYYVISLFKIHKGGKITKDVLRRSHEVTDLWRRHIRDTYPLSPIQKHSHVLNVFRSIGLLLHASSGKEISKDKILHVYSEVFGDKDTGMFDYALMELVEKMFVSAKGDGYTAHDSHIEALEYAGKNGDEMYPLESDHIKRYAEMETDVGSLFSLSIWCYYKKKYKEMVNIIDKIVKIKPDYAIAWLNKGVALDYLGRHQEAIASYDKALEIDEKLVQAWNSRGAALGDLGKYSEALDSCDKALAIKPDYAEAWSNRGNALDKLGRHQDAVDSYNKALAIKPDYAEALSNKGVALGNLGRYDEAIKSCEEAIKIDPNFAMAWYNKCTAFHNLGMYEDEIKSYDEAIKMDSKLAQAWSNKGATLDKLGRYDEAIKSYDEAIRIDPNDAKTLSNKGATLDKLGRYDEAIKSYDEAIKVDPNYAKAWYNKGNTLNNIGKHEDAVASYDKALAIKPDYAEAWSNRGNALDKLGRHQDAVASYDKAVAINPNLAEAWYNKGVVLGNLGKDEDAVASYDKALEIDSNLAQAWSSRGAALGKLGKYHEALASSDKAIAINPHLAQAWSNKGTALGKLGKYEDAINSLFVSASLFILQGDSLDLAIKILRFIMNNAKDNQIKDDAKVMFFAFSYMGDIAKEQVLNEIGSLDALSTRARALANAIVNKDTPIKTSNRIDEAFELLRTRVLGGNKG